jgi:hypothetical protein
MEASPSPTNEKNKIFNQSRAFYQWSSDEFLLRISTSLDFDKFFTEL